MDGDGVAGRQLAPPRRACGGRMSIRVLILHEQRLFREGLRAVLHGREEIDVVADSDDRAGIGTLIGNTRPDVLMIDLAAGPLGTPYPPAVVALGEDRERFELARALRSGIFGLVSKCD